MAHFRGGDRPFASLHNLLKMLLSPHQSNKPVHQDNEMAEDVDEPPEHHFIDTSTIHADDGLVYVKSPTVVTDHKESLLTRALKHSPVLSPSEQHPSQDHPLCRSYPYSISGMSTAELTSDGGLTSPSLSNTPSPPLPAQFTNRSSPARTENNKAAAGQAGESAVEANLGRKRCISFACGRKAEEPKPQQQPPTPQRPVAQGKDSEPTPTEPLKRKTTLTFVCPARDPDTRQERSPLRGAACRARPRGSPAPVARKASPEKTALSIPSPQEQKSPAPDRRAVIPSGLGKFEESEATRFHEFASSVEEDDEWVVKSSDYKEKITLSDCMKKENAIRKLGEEAEAEEAMEEEEAEEDEDEDDEDEDEEDEDADDDSTVHDFSDDGNESDNEAGFADSDESEDGSEYEFWAPTSTTAATTPQTLEIPRTVLPRRDSNTSFDSAKEDRRRRWPPALSGKSVSRPTKVPKMRPSTPNLPDSTDFVCGTFDEDRPLEAAYKSCMEQRRLSKQIVIPQDIDPSFPTSDPEDEEDDDGLAESMVVDEAPRGRPGADQSRKQSPRTSPRRMVSPPPPTRRHSRLSPRRLRSPPPPVKFKSPFKSEGAATKDVPRLDPRGMNISELVQRPPMTRTKSLPRTPNPFFTKAHQWTGIVPLRESPERESSRTREVHTRGPIDIVEGLEKKRQKRKEKFWRQHCRKAAKEQMERRPIPGKGAERMKDLGLAVAERCRAYGVGENAQLVLSV